MTQNNEIALGIAFLAVYFIGQQWWRAHCKKMDRDDLIHRAATDSAAAASVKYANEHPVQLRAAVYDDGTEEDAKAYWMGREAVEKAAYAEAVAHPDIAIAMMRRREREIQRAYGPGPGAKEQKNEVLNSSRR